MSLHPLMKLPRWLRWDRTVTSAALYLRQAELVGLAAEQRVELAESHARIQASSLWMETGLSVVRSIRAHPQAVLLSLMAASMTFGKGMSQVRSWTLRGLALHQLYRLMGSSVLQLFRRKPEQDPAAP
jgi:hypothetical protein